MVVACLGFVMWCGETRAVDRAPLPAATQQVLDGIPAMRAQGDVEGRRYADALNRQGDAAYRKGRFDVAASKYMHSYPNYPNARAYLLAGDAHWRAVVRYQLRHSSTDACGWNNRDFARHMEMDLDQHALVGQILAERENDARVMRTGLHARSVRATACLRGMAREYQALPPQTCVDVRRVRSCLGPPLIR